MPSTYSTDALIAVVAGFPPPVAALLDRYFTVEAQEEAEEIHIDKIASKLRISPFVSPLVEGQIVESEGFQTNTIKPAYVKDKRVFDPNKPFKRAIGEQIGGTLSPAQRRDAYVASEMTNQIEMLTRRLEVMASEVIRTGKVTIEGVKYPKVVVDFGRDAALTATAPSVKWDQKSTAKPISNLRAWAKTVRQKSGAHPIDAIMGEDAFEAFWECDQVQKALDIRNLSAGTLGVEPITFQGLTLQSTGLAGFNVWTYSGQYVDPITNATSDIWPAAQVALCSPAIEGVRAFGAIRDGKAGFRAMPYFPKMWEDEDPAVEYLMMQSAPLTVPQRPDATLGVTVL